MLELVNLTRLFGKNRALDGLTFSVSPGEVVGFLGPNGAGKTTAMRAVLGITQLDSGSVIWNGRPAILEDRVRFGYMPEERGLYPTMQVIDQLVFLARLHGMSKSQARTESIRWLETFGLADRAGGRLDALSLGNQQRVQMAAALVHKPKLLVLDEPFSGLDPTGIDSLSRVLTERARQGTAVVFSSHQLDLVEGLCERVVIVDKGKDVAQGTVAELTASNELLSVRVEGDSEAQWAMDLHDVEFRGIDHGNARIKLSGQSSLDYVMDAARRAGTVSHFSVDRKRLSEVFREAVQK